MKKQVDKLDIDKIKASYFETLMETEESVPYWMSDVIFVENNNLRGAVAMANAEGNSVEFRSDATPHAIFHELEHLRSRHKESVVGFDDELEKPIRFYFIGYHQGGFDGIFLEEGFNELAARKLYLKSLKGDDEARRLAFDEYYLNKYYEFEMYTVIGLSCLLGMSAEQLRNLKYTGDCSGQEFIKNRVSELSGDSTLWTRMQYCLDGYEIAKRTIIDEKSKSEFKKESIVDYYNLAYELLFKALENKKITKEEFKKRLHYFESYFLKTTGMLIGVKEAVEHKKDSNLIKYRSSLLKNHVLTFAKNSRPEVFSFGDSMVKTNIKEVSPMVLMPSAKKLIFSRFRKRRERTLENVFEESKYGLN